jgi:YidC/Oxa1 family membrane protein insertase
MWKTFIYTPLLNALILLLSHVTFGDLGLAIVLLTIIIKVILFPLSKKAIVSQLEMASLQDDIAKIKDKKLTKEEEAKETFELYKTKKVNPFSGCLVMLIQLPIIFGLYYVFLKGLDLTAAPLYSFVDDPSYVNTKFLGFIDLLSKNNYIIAILTGLSQLVQGFMSPTQKLQKNQTNTQTGFAADLQKSMQVQVKYILPIFIGFIAFQIQAAVGLYWIVNNIFTIFQEKAIAKSIKNKEFIHKKAEVVS